MAGERRNTRFIQARLSLIPALVQGLFEPEQLDAVAQDI
jgi:hypothetical protein